MFAFNYTVPYTMINHHGYFMERSLETPDLDPLFCDFDFRGSFRVWDFPLSFVNWSETLSLFTYHSLFPLRWSHSVAVLGILVLVQCRSEKQLGNFSNYLAGFFTSAWFPHWWRVGAEETRPLWPGSGHPPAPALGRVMAGGKARPKAPHSPWTEHTPPQA